MKHKESIQNICSNGFVWSEKFDEKKNQKQNNRIIIKSAHSRPNIIDVKKLMPIHV